MLSIKHVRQIVIFATHWGRNHPSKLSSYGGLRDVLMAAGEGQMPKRTYSFGPAILVILLAAALLGPRAGLAQEAADNCVTKPGADALPGSHWYFHFDRANHRQCWYLGPEGVKAVETAAQQPLLMGSATPAKLIPEAIAASASAVSGDVSAAPTFALRWPDALGSLGSTAREFASMSSGPASDSYAEVPATSDTQATNDTQNDLPAAWPILAPADRTLAGMSTETLTALNRMLAIFAGALGFSALIIRANFQRSAARRITRANFREWGPSSEITSRPGERVQSASVDLDAVARPNDSVSDFGAELMLLLREAETE